MKLKKIVLILFFVFFVRIFAGGAAGVVGNFLPTVMESATLANIVNVFMKVSDWMTATGKVVSSVKQSVNYIKDAKDAVENIVQTAKSVKTMDFYNTDSWAEMIANANIISNNPYQNNILNSLGMFEIYAMDGISGFTDSYLDMKNLKIEEIVNNNRQIIKEIFTPNDEPANFLEDITTGGKTPKESYSESIYNLSKIQNNLAKQLSNPTLSYDEKRKLQESFSQVNKKMLRIRQKITIMKEQPTPTNPSHSDSIFIDVEQMMVQNLIQTKAIYTMVNEFSDYTAEMRYALERLKNNQISSIPKGDRDLISDYSQYAKDMSEIEDEDNDRKTYGDKPNQAPIPEFDEEKSSKDYSFGDMDKAETNTQDIISLRNAINYTLLKQERMLRDIEAMKTNSMAYLLIIDGIGKSEELAHLDILKINSTAFKKAIK